MIDPITVFDWLQASAVMGLLGILGAAFGPGALGDGRGSFRQASA
jgi:hypothetical protein